MTHLDDAELIDALDGALPSARGAHLAACETCRAQIEGLRAALATVASDRTPEPSPLFWDHFATRVNERLDSAPAGRHWFGIPRLAFVALGSVAVLLLAVNLLVAPRGTETPAPPQAVAAGEAPDAAPEVDDLDADADWAIVRAAAADLNVEDAQAEGLTARPGTADRLAMELTEAERAELLRLLQNEMKTGA